VQEEEEEEEEVEVTGFRARRWEENVAFDNILLLLKI
jgi:hypothetical protein